VEETDIIELEKRYWTLKAQSKSGRFDKETFQPLISPPVPESLCNGECSDDFLFDLTEWYSDLGINWS
jgi:hypothetical protein